VKVLARLDIPRKVEAKVESRGLENEGWIEKIAFDQVQRRSEVFDASKV
jgi:hypothetical protein